MKDFLGAAAGVFVLGAVVTGLVGALALGVAAVTVVPVGITALVFRVFGL